MQKNSARTWNAQGEELNYGLNDRELDRRCRELCALRGYSYRAALEELHQEFCRAEHEREYAAELEREQRENRIEARRAKASPEEELESIANDMIKTGCNKFTRQDLPRVFALLADAYDRNHGDMAAVWSLVKGQRYNYSKICEEMKTA